MVIFVHSLWHKNIKCLVSKEVTTISCSEIKRRINVEYGLPSTDFWLELNGRRIEDDHFIHDGSVVRVLLTLPGGKGGFGSMLRAIGAQIEKTTNREACRDLSGRRLRDINEEQRLKRWVTKQAERERQAAKRRRARLERLKTLPKHNFEDPNYDKERAELPERIDDALNQGLSHHSEAGPSQKRKSSETLVKQKKTCLWLGVDNLPDSDESDDSSSNKSDITATESQNSADNDESKGSDFFEKRRSDDSISQNSLKKSDNESNSTVDSTLHNDFNKADKENATSTTKEQSGKGDVTDIRMNESSSTESVQNVQQKSRIEEETASLVLSETSQESQDSSTPNKSEALDLMSYSDVEELKRLGLDVLKSALIHLGMKCGGTLQQRAERLWAVRGIDPKNIDPSLLAKSR